MQKNSQKCFLKKERLKRYYRKIYNDKVLSLRCGTFVRVPLLFLETFPVSSFIIMLRVCRISSWVSSTVTTLLPLQLQFLFHQAVPTLPSKSDNYTLLLCYWWLLWNSWVLPRLSLECGWNPERTEENLTKTGRRRSLYTSILNAIKNKLLFETL